MGGYILGSEDCLSLNIFAPSNDLNALKPVMVWIHGGAFVFGSGMISLYLKIAIVRLLKTKLFKIFFL